MEIQWYPGHMAKARRIMEETLSLIDVVIELLDARIPFSSRNPEIDALAGNKKRLIVLNKSDMSDPLRNKEWESFFRASGSSVIIADSIKGVGIGEVYEKTRFLVKDKLDKMEKKGLKNVTVRAMVAGIPNVGKSAFINKVTGRRGAAVENRPGVTKSKQWLKVRKDFELLDTPGILWPKFEDTDIASKLALTGAIKDELLDKHELSIYLLKILEDLYPTALPNRYGIETGTIDENEILERIAEKRGFKLKGGSLDMNRTCSTLLDELRKCKLGRITLELPPTK